MSEIEQLDDPEALASWAQRALPLKNQLSVADAQLLEVAFADRLTWIGEAGSKLDPADASGPAHLPSEIPSPIQPVTVISKPVRERDRNHLRFVASRPCLICGRTPSDAHHIRFAEQRAMGRKVSDRFTVPVCRLHHRELHRRGNERAWWQSKEIDPIAIATDLWARTHEQDPMADYLPDQLEPVRSPPKLNGRHVKPAHPINDETKPIIHPEAG
jgi:hypothetical protein